MESLKILNHVAGNNLQESISYDRSKLLGRGSYNTRVYQGQFGNRDVAVKMLNVMYIDGKESETALKEISLMSHLDWHPNVVRYFKAEMRDEFILIAIELCTCNLRKWITNSDIACKKEVEILEQISHGLKHLHDNKIVHGDLKPENILIACPDDGNIQAKISDFGLSVKLREGKATSYTLGAGTEGWIAPEVITYNDGFNGRFRVGLPVDIFSLGCIFYFVLTRGDHPFGSRILRQTNIQQTNRKSKIYVEFFKALDKFKAVAKFKAEAFIWLIYQMIKHDATKRPIIDAILNHPAFWEAQIVFDFLNGIYLFLDEYQDIMTNPETLSGKGKSWIANLNWINALSHPIQEYVRTIQDISEGNFSHLIKVIVEIYRNYANLPSAVQQLLSYTPDKYIMYWIEHFPFLLPLTWTIYQYSTESAGALETYYMGQCSFKFGFVEPQPSEYKSSEANAKSWLDFLKQSRPKTKFSGSKSYSTPIDAPRLVAPIRPNGIKNRAKVSKGINISPIKHYGTISYDRTNLLGRGPYRTQVFKGFFQHTDVAIKTVSFEEFESKVAVKEINTLTNLDLHPNIANYFKADFIEDEDLVLIAIELCQMNLSQFVKTGEFLQVDARTIITQITHGLIFLHSKQIIHGNLKPKNILISLIEGEQPSVKVSDFGLSRQIQSVSTITLSDAMGTLCWMAPEILRKLDDENNRDEKSNIMTQYADIFALGCIFYFVLTGGKHPFGNGFQAQANIIHEKSELDLRAINQAQKFKAEAFIWLISQMIMDNKYERPEVDIILMHPALWGTNRILSFFEDVYPYLGLYKDSAFDNASRFFTQTKDWNWLGALDHHIYEFLITNGTVDGTKCLHLVKVIVEMYKAYSRLPEEIKRLLGESSENYLAYWGDRFSFLLPFLWTIFQHLEISLPVRNEYYVGLENYKFGFVGPKPRGLNNLLKDDAKPLLNISMDGDRKIQKSTAADNMAIKPKSLIKVIVGSQVCSLNKIMLTLVKTDNICHFDEWKWCDIARALDVSGQKIKTLRSELILNKISLSDACNAIIEEWCVKKGKDAMLEELINALNIHGLRKCSEALHEEFMISKS